MDQRIASPSLVSDIASKQVRELLDEICTEENINSPVFYYNFPLFRDNDNVLHKTKVVLASKSHGLILIAPTTNAESDDELEKKDSELSQLDTIIYSKLLRSRLLRKNKREIKISISSLIFSCESTSVDINSSLENELVFSKDSLRIFIQQNSTPALSEDEWEELTSLIEGGSGVSRSDERDVSQLPENSPAVALKRIEEKICNFDRDQRRAAITVVNGPQRIRGIAGSGKTIVLAMKAAHLHMINPKAEILFTFWTKALYDLIKQQITRFYRQFSDADPDWSKLHILHAWGGKNSAGVYYNSCVDNMTSPFALRDVPSTAKSKFDYVCSSLLSRSRINPKYDYILIDEGQDLPKSFYKLCFELCRGGKIDRNIIWAYDELQTIMDANIQDTRETFGQNHDNIDKIDLDRAHESYSQGMIPHDIVLKKSYRNSAEVIVSAHALGLGLYSSQPVQILENKEHWEDLGYEVTRGNCIAGEETVITRPKENSPVNLSDYIEENNLIEWKQADSFNSEVEWIATEIEKFINQGLNPEDILVISSDDRHAKSYFSKISFKLFEKAIETNNVHESYSIPKFFIEGKVTLSTVYKAKGNEAPVVFVCGIDAIAPYIDNVTTRNKIFTSFTRSRGWLRVSGMNNSVQRIFSELDRATKLCPEMRFIYPNKEQIQLIQRDLSEKAKSLKEFQQLALQLNLSDLSEEEILQAIKSAKEKK